MIGSAECEQGVAHCPGGHADDEHPFYAEPGKEQRHEEHEANFGHLAESLGAGDGGESGRPEIELREIIVGCEGYADQERAGEEDEEGSAGQFAQGIDAENRGDGDFLPRPDGGVLGREKQKIPRMMEAMAVE